MKECIINEADAEKDKSIKWDKRFIDVAKMVSTWSTCIRNKRQIGSVIVKDKRILTTGYNGAPSGVQSCAERGVCLRDEMGIESGTRHEICYAIHAEQNAIIQAAKLGLSVEGATIYVTHRPCSICTKIIINSGIKRIVFAQNYPDEFSMGILRDTDIEFCEYIPKK